MRRAAGSTSRPFAIARSAGRTSRKARFGVSKWSLKSVSNGHSEPSVDSSVCMAGARAPAIAGAAETSTRAAPRLSATTKRVKHEGSLNPPWLGDARSLSLAAAAGILGGVSVSIGLPVRAFIGTTCRTFRRHAKFVHLARS